MRRRAARGALALLLISVMSCAPQGMSRRDVSEQLLRRTQATLRPANTGTDFSRPPGVTERDGLSEREAIALALWNNAAFQAELAQLELSRADLVDASLLPNPFLSLVLPLGPRQLAAYVNLPLEVLWQRPRRIETAERELSRVGTALVQTGLDLVRDVRLAYVDTQASSARERALHEGATLLEALRRVARVRLAAGDIARTELLALEADGAALEARAAQARAERDAAHARLGRLTGLGASLPSTLPELEGRAPDDEARAHARLTGDAASLRRDAFAARPDLRAAEIAVEAASARLGWERSRAWALLAVLDGGTSAGQGFGVSPGVRFELPLFSRNQGGISRAEAELQRAAWRYVAVQQQIVAELESALAAYRHASDALAHTQEHELRAAQALVALAQAGYASGELAGFAVLDAQRRLVDARLRALEARAALQRARVEVERSLGGLVDAQG